MKTYEIISKLILQPLLNSLITVFFIGLGWFLVANDREIGWGILAVMWILNAASDGVANGFMMQEEYEAKGKN